VVSALFVVFFIKGIFDTVAEIDQIDKIKEINQPEFNFGLDNQHNLQQVINLNDKLGGKILKISYYILNIVFLVNLIVILLVFELFEIHLKNARKY
jgi:hypothetical protein